MIAPLPPAPPRSLRLLGWSSLLVGPGLAALNLALGFAALHQLGEAGVTDGPNTAVITVMAIFTGLGLLLALGGIGLIGEKRWGRWVSLTGAALTFPGLVTAVIVIKIVESWPFDHPMPPVSFIAGAPALSPLFGILLLVMLNLPEVRAWARGSAVTPGAPAPGTAAATARTETLAIASFALSLIPFVLLTQITSLILGIIALRRIARARGALAGRGFAIAGVAISSAILLFIIGILLLVLVLSSQHSK
jgi:hypothetical protein